MDVDATLCGRENMDKFVKDSKKGTLLPKGESKNPMVGPTSSSKSTKNLLTNSVSEGVFSANSKIPEKVQDQTV